MKVYLDWCTVEGVQLGVDIYITEYGVMIGAALFKIIVVTGVSMEENV